MRGDRQRRKGKRTQTARDHTPYLTMPVEKAMRTQRAIRRIKPDAVDDDVLLHLIELALKAPTGGNRQNAEFVIVRDRAVKHRLAQLNRLAWSTYGGIWRYFARGDEKTLRAMKAVDWEAAHYEDIPVIVVACLRATAYGPIVSGFRLPFPPFWESIFYGSIYPGVQNLLLAARAAGLGASLTVMPLWSATLARGVLGLPHRVLLSSAFCFAPLSASESGRVGCR